MHDFLIAVGCLFTVAVCASLMLVRVVVNETETALYYRSGVYKRTLAPGAHWMLRAVSRVTCIDLRERVLTVPGQEVLTSDQIGLKVSLAVTYAVVDPVAATHRVEDFVNRIYVEAQLSLRTRIGAVALDQLLLQRIAIGPGILEDVKPRAALFGLDIRAIDVKDVMLPAEIRRAHSEIVRAQKEGQAAIERVRTETASLRSLANAAKMIEDNPALYQLRLLQAVSSVSGSPTIVLNAGDLPIQMNGRSNRPAGAPASPNP